MLVLSNCATPAEHFDAVADGYGFSHTTLYAPRFGHKVYYRAGVRNGDAAETLHVYLDGDGTPWEHKRRIADDPTAREPLILDLLRRDPAPAILLGRPCYYGFSAAPECDNALWTAQRYSQTVVDSMAAALRRWLREHPYRRLVFIGYSGGGVLAVLLAPYFDNTAAVMTVAANLDTAGWSRYHGYSPLRESLNPLTQPPLDERIRQVHLAGGKDSIVPLSVIKAYTELQANAFLKIYNDYSHVCCWEDAWKEIMDYLH
ncbi:MAG: alpha/beta fold hydrolase [Gammaproteobacteria bacterium]